ncbi:MAG: ATP synthase subunit I [Legionella sp.]|nr:ATP synthase subunit I [Legionella sp.]
MKRINDNLKRLTMLQLFISIVAAVLFLTLGNWRLSISSLLGGMVALLPSSLFAWYFFRYQGARAARQMFQALFLGEMWKWLLTVVLCVSLFKLMNIIPEAFFLTYGMVLLTHWTTPLFFNKLK